MFSDFTFRRFGDGDYVLHHTAHITESTTVAKIDSTEFTVTFTHPDHLHYHLRAASTRERDNWVDALANAKQFKCIPAAVAARLPLRAKPLSPVPQQDLTPQLSHKNKPLPPLPQQKKTPLLFDEDDSVPSAVNFTPDSDTAAAGAHLQHILVARQRESDRLFCYDLDPNDDAQHQADSMQPLLGLWGTGFYTGFVGDCFIANTDLEGGGGLVSQSNGGGSIEMCSRFMKVIKAAHNVDKSPFLLPSVFPDKPAFQRSLDAVIDVLDNAFCAPCHDKDHGVAAAAVEFKRRLEALPPTNGVMLWVTGWPKPDPGHCIVFIFVRRDENHYDLVCCNAAQDCS